jgi:hypothetical protein
LGKPQARLKVEYSLLLPPELGNFPHISTWVKGLKIPGKALSLLTYLFSPSSFVSNPILFTNLFTYIQIADLFFFLPTQKTCKTKGEVSKYLETSKQLF